MRKGICFFLVLLLMMSVSGCRPAPRPPSEEEAAALASQFILTLADEDFPVAYAAFDSQMQEAISEDQLAQIWQDLKGQLGPFVREADQRQETQPPYRIVTVTIQMGSNYLDTRLVFNADKEIAGLFFQPSDYLARFYEPPDYADESLFAEYDVLVGSGEWALPATLTIPEGEGPFPFVVLVHGSGPHDRNETIGPNRPFQDLAWGLASRGVGVLRYEKRTKTHAQKMVHLLESLTPDEEVVEDAVAAVALLKDTPEAHLEQIFVLGHSLGGILTPRIAGESSGVAGMIILAGTPRPLEDRVLEQVTYLLSLKDEITAADREYLDTLAQQVARVKDPGLSTQVPAADLPLGMPASYWLYLNAYDVLAEAREANAPLLILQGERDYQVTLEDFQGWKDGLAEHPGVTTRSYPALNHLFMAGEGPPDPAEYMETGHVDPQVVEDIAKWIMSVLEANPDE